MCTRRVQVHVTGFGPFHGVESNPTSELVRSMPKRLQEAYGSDAGVRFGSFTIIETSAVGALSALGDLALQQPLDEQEKYEGVVWLHLGVAANQTEFKLEECAVNEATFRCPDERGWTPMDQCILPQYPKDFVLNPALPLADIRDKLAPQNKAKVQLSQDCGKFVCNWLYFHSLHRCRKQAERTGRSNHYALFLHVPPFEAIPQEEQERFIINLIDVLVSFVQSHAE